MKYRTLGRTGISASTMGFGGGGVGHFWGTTDETESVRAIRRAIDLGINYFDVARMYRTAEEYLGKALEGQRRDSVAIATKVSFRPEQLNDIAGAARSSVEESLRQLRTDHVDVLGLHNRVVNQRGPQDGFLTPQQIVGPGGVLEAFRTLQREGKTRFIGLTGSGDIEALTEVLASDGFDTILIYHNVIHQNCLGTKPNLPTDMPVPLGILPLATSHHMGTVGIRSLAMGALTDQLDRPAFPESELARDVRKAGTLRFLLKGQVKTLQQAAMLYVLMNEDIHTQVPGFKNVAEVEEGVACVDLPPISSEDLGEIDRLYLQSFGVVA